MYCEDLIFDVKEGINPGENLEQFFYANFGLVKFFQKAYGVRNEEFEDFSQLCFIACMNAIKAYKKGTSNSFLSYYRRCVLHEFYEYKMEQRFPYKVNREDAKILSANGFCCIEYSDIVQSFGKEYLFTDLDENYNESEKRMMARLLWELVEEQVDTTAVNFLQDKFIHKMSYRELALKHSIEPSRVYNYYAKLLKKLKRSSDLKELADVWWSCQ